MKHLYFLLLTPVLAFAEGHFSEPYATVGPAHLEAVGRFVPAGWQVTALAAGDLNADGRDDYALLVEPEDEFGPPYRRLLTVLSDEDESNLGANTLTHSDQYWSFIPPVQDGADPLKYIAINNGLLEIQLDRQAVNGNRSLLTYAFRRQNGLFVLSSFQRYQVKRSTGMFTDTRIDLDKGKQETTSGSMSSPRHKQSKGRYKAQQVWTPCLIEDALGFEP